MMFSYAVERVGKNNSISNIKKRTDGSFPSFRIPVSEGLSRRNFHLPSAVLCVEEAWNEWEEVFEEWYALPLTFRMSFIVN